MSRPRWAQSSQSLQYSPLESEQHDFANPCQTSTVLRTLAYISRRLRLLFIYALLATVLLLSLFAAKNENVYDWAPSPLRPSCLFLLVPAQEASAGLCKTLASSAVLGYPPPNLIGWEKDYSSIPGGVELGRLTETFNYLDELESQQDDSLVLIVNGGSVWFQLRPDVLIARYLNINHAANLRTYAQLGRGMTRERIKQKIVFAARRDCPEKGNRSAGCFEAPGIPLQFLAGHAMIGPVQDVRGLYHRALQKSRSAAAKNVDSSADSIFNEIYREQEVGRVRSRTQHQAWTRILLDRWNSRRSITDAASIVDSLARSSARDHADDEFGIGLDSDGAIFGPFVDSGPRLKPLPHSDATALATLSRAARQEKSTRQTSLSAFSDAALRASKPPFWTYAQGRNATHLPALNTSWADVPLLTDMKTGIAPVAVPTSLDHTPTSSSDDADADGWQSSWFASNGRLRPLLYAHAVSPIEVLARVRLLSNAQPHDPFVQRSLSAYEDSSLYYDSRTRAVRPLAKKIAAYASMLPSSLFNGLQGAAPRTHDWWPAGLQREGAHVWGGDDVQWDRVCWGGDDRLWGDKGGDWRQTGWWPA